MIYCKFSETGMLWQHDGTIIDGKCYVVDSSYEQYHKEYRKVEHISASGKVYKRREIFLIENPAPLMKLENRCLFNLCADVWWLKEGGYPEINTFLIERDYKFGYGDFNTGEMIIPIQYDLAYDFYYLDEALVSKDGYFSYINKKGEPQISFSYEDGEHNPVFINKTKYYKVKKDGYWGMITENEEIFIPFEWDKIETDEYFIYCYRNTQKKDPRSWNYYVRKCAVYDHNYSEIIPCVLTEKPILCKAKGYYTKSAPPYFLVQRGRKYGVLCSDGRLIARPVMHKRAADGMLSKLTGTTI